MEVRDDIDVDPPPAMAMDTFVFGWRDIILDASVMDNGSSFISVSMLDDLD